MYRHKSLKQLLCCLLLLCLCFGSSAALFSVNADTVINANRIVYDRIYFQGSSLYSGIDFYYSCVSFDPFQTDFEVETIQPAAGTYWQMFSKAVSQYYVLDFKLTNNTDDIAKWTNAYIELQINCPAIAPFNNVTPTIGEEIFQIGGSASYAEIGTNGRMWISLNPEYMYGNNIVLPPHSQLSGYIIFQRNYNYTSNMGNNTDIIGLSYFDCPVSSVTIYQPSSTYFAIDNSIQINNTVYNIQSIDSELKAVYALIAQFSSLQHGDLNQLHSDLAALNNQNSTIISEQQETNSNITQQTEQQEQQYNEFSAGSDSSDSSNINSAISGGTDAVKQKMGLFSFFDGIVNSMSDILTSDHERSLVLPALDVPLPDQTVHIWDRKEFDFDELENNFGALLTVVRFATVAICYSVMISGAYNIFHKFIGVEDGDA